MTSYCEKQAPEGHSWKPDITGSQGPKHSKISCDFPTCSFRNANASILYLCVCVRMSILWWRILFEMLLEKHDSWWGWGCWCLRIIKLCSAKCKAQWLSLIVYVSLLIDWSWKCINYFMTWVIFKKFSFQEHAGYTKI